MPVKTTRLYTPPTQQLLTPEQQRIGRYIAAGAVLFLVIASIVLDIRERRAAAQPTAAPVIILIATPTPQPPAPTVAPAVVAPPTLAPEPTPTALPTIIYEPVYIEVQAAPEVEPPTAAPEPTPIQGWVYHEPAPAVEGGCVRTRGGGICQLARP